MHLIAYNGRDDKLFRAGIMESGNSVSYVGEFGSDRYQPIYDAIVRNTNCTTAIDTLDCIRGLPFATLNTAFNTTNSSQWFPIVDGDILARYGSVQLSEGAFVHVPIISGANTDEGVSFGLAGINTTAQFTNAIQSKSIIPDATVQVKLLTIPPSWCFPPVHSSCRTSSPRARYHLPRSQHLRHASLHPQL